MGFAASEIVHRQFVVCFIPDSLLVAESARLIQFQVSGQILGLLIGGQHVAQQLNQNLIQDT